MTPEPAWSRHVVLDGAVNVRDIGGYRNTHGLEVVRGRLLRGDSLSQLTAADAERLGQLGLRTVIDFRTPGEVLLSGADRLPAGIESVHLPVSGGDLGAVYEIIASGDHERQRRELGDGRAASFMVGINRAFVTDGRQREAFGLALRLVCAPGQLPLLYHCSGGKDRSGWMTAIVLTALGVPRELVLRDYLLSNDLHRTGYAKLRLDLIKTGIVADPGLLRPVLEQSPTYLRAAFEEADRSYGSFSAFLASGLDVTQVMLDQLRLGLLEDLAPPEPLPFVSLDLLASAGGQLSLAWALAGWPLRRRGPRRRIRSQVSSVNTTPSAISRPMSLSQFDELWAHSGSVLPGAETPMTLRFTVDATAPKPQRDGAM
jgi:protein-tyrosine phosphatase